MYKRNRLFAKPPKIQRRTNLLKPVQAQIEAEEFTPPAPALPAFNKQGLVSRESLNPANILQMQKTLGNQTVRRLLAAPSSSPTTIQRRTNTLPSADSMLSQAPEGWFGGGAYEDVVEAVREYYTEARTPADNHGVQLYRLDAIAKGISDWETKHGAVTKPVVSGLFGMDKQDQRRLVLKDLKTKLATEETTVKNQGHVAADLAHKSDRDTLVQYVNEGLSSTDRRLKNSCEWIMLAKKSFLYAVTPTGDAFQRLDKAGKNVGKDQAFFPQGLGADTGHVAKSADSYNHLDVTDNTGVFLKPGGRSTGGWNAPGFIAIVSPASQPKAEVLETIRHEVQHDADKNRGRDSGAGLHKAGKDYEATGESAAGLTLDGNDVDPSTLPVNPQARAAALQASAEVKLRRYKTEFRAYSYQEGDSSRVYGGLDNSVQNVAHDGVMFSARQLAIFKHIYAAYPHTKTGWDNNSVLADGTTTFRQAVQAYWNPDSEGFNKYNSARVDDFYLALDKIGAKDAQTGLEAKHGINAEQVTGKISDVNDGDVKALMTSIEKLHGDDADYIMNESPDMLRKIAKHLDGAALTAVRSRLTDLANESKMGSLFD